MLLLMQKYRTKHLKTLIKVNGWVGGLTEVDGSVYSYNNNIIIILFLYSANSHMADRCAVQEI